MVLLVTRMTTGGAPCCVTTSGAPCRKTTSGAPYRMTTGGAPCCTTTSGAPCRMTTGGAPCCMTTGGAPCRLTTSGASMLHDDQWRPHVADEQQRSLHLELNGNPGYEPSEGAPETPPPTYDVIARQTSYVSHISQTSDQSRAT